MGPPTTRRTLLAAGLGSLVTGCAPDAAPVPAPGESSAVPRPRSPLPRLDRLAFSVHGRSHPVTLVEERLPHVRERRVGAVSSLTRRPTRPAAPFLAVDVEVVSADGTVAAGLLSEDLADGVLVTLAGDRLALVRRSGGHDEVLAAGRTSSRRIALALCENRLTALALEDDHWEPVLTTRPSVTPRSDLRSATNLARLGFAWGATTGTADLGDVRAGSFGQVGLRDPHLVQHADGSPYVRDGRYWMTWTCAGLGFFEQAHWGVFSVDPRQPGRLRPEAKLFASRGGQILGDHAGQLVRDGDRWLVANSSWGSFGSDGVHVRWAESTADLLTGVHVLPTEQLALPTTHGSWDPGMTRIDGEWVVTYVESPSQEPFVFHPALARTAAREPWSGLRAVASRTDLRQTEGPLLVQAAGGWRVLASNGDARRFRVLDLELRDVGDLRAPYSTNIPHTQLVRLGRDWWIYSFDDTDGFRPVLGYGGHGDMVLLRASRS